MCCHSAFPPADGKGWRPDEPCLLPLGCSPAACPLSGWQASCLLSWGPNKEENSRVTGAFSSSTSSLSSSSCQGSFLNSERSVCSSWETASWARDAASGGGAFLGRERSELGWLLGGSQHQREPSGPFHQGGPSGGSNDYLHPNLGPHEQVKRLSLGS